MEELPEYTAHPALPDHGKKGWKEVLRLKWWILPIIILIIIVSIVGGVIGNNHNQKQNPEQVADPSDPLITALTTTECAAGKFVFYQVNSTEIYLHGQLSDGYWNDTFSQDILSISLHLSETNLPPYYGSNLTAVCYTSRNESADEDTVVSLFSE